MSTTDRWRHSRDDGPLQHYHMIQLFRQFKMIFSKSIHYYIIVSSQCASNVCAKKCFDRKVAYKFEPKIFSSAMAQVQLGLSLNKVRRYCILKADSFSPILIVRPVSYLISPATLFMFAYYRRNNYCCARISVFQT